MKRSILLMTTIILGASATLIGHAQSDQNPLRFEVASVKPNTSIDGKIGVSMSPSGRVIFTRISLRDLIWIAYATTDIQGTGQIVGGPSWLTTDHFDIEAKADGPLTDDHGQTIRDRLNLMLKSLLEDRFHAQAHIEKRQTQIYALVLANKDGKLGPAIHTTTHDCPKEADCGVRNRGGFVVATGVTIDDIARAFPNFGLVDGPTKNATGLTGRFDFELKYTPPVPSSPEQVDPRPNTDFIASFLTDFQEQLGLRLQQQNGTADFLVIDHVEHPTPD